MVSRPATLQQLLARFVPSTPPVSVPLPAQTEAADSRGEVRPTPCEQVPF